MRPHRRLRLLPLVPMLVLLATGCGDERPGLTGTPTATGPTPATTMTTVPLGERPFQLFVPSTYEPAEPAPLVILLHGYTSNSSEARTYFGLIRNAESRGFLVAMPEGTRNPQGDQFWNATDVCCDMFGSGVEDSTYLSQLIDTVREAYAVDAVFLIGHSNGAYMSHRMACEHADQITAIAALAGVLWLDPARCSPSRPVSVLQIHGTADALVAYGGGEFDAGTGYPGAEETVARWRGMDGCSDGAEPAGAPRDLDIAVPGAETVVTSYRAGCGGGTRVELWRMEGSGHVPRLTADFTPAVLDFFASLS